jgi:hypothetical protein
MNLSKSLLIAFTFLSLTIDAQTEVKWVNVTLKTSIPHGIKLLGKHKTSYIYLETESSYLYPRSKASFVTNYNAKVVPYITMYDQDLNLISSNEIKLDESETRFNFRLEDVIMIEDNLILFTSLYEQKDKKRDCFMTVLNIDGSSKSQTIELGKIMQSNPNNSNFFTITASQNNKSFLVHLNQNYINYQNAKIHYRLFDKNAIMLWDKEIELPYTGKNINLSNYVIDENYNLFFFGSVFDFVEKDKKSSVELGEIGEHSVFKLENKSTQFSMIPIKMNEKQRPIYYNLSIKNNMANLYGFYKEGETIDAKGVCVFNIDLSKEKVLSKDVKAFSNELTTFFEINKKEFKSNKFIRFEVRDIIYNSDGGYTFISEYFDTYNTFSSNNGVVNITNHFLYLDILITNVDSKGKIKWITRVPKKQYVLDTFDTRISYNYVSINNTIYIVYLDAKKNLPLYASNPQIDLSKIKNVIVGFPTTSILVKVSSNGEFSKEPIVDKTEKRDFLITQNSILRGKEIIFLVHKKKYSFKLGRLNI